MFCAADVLRGLGERRVEKRKENTAAARRALARSSQQARQRAREARRAEIAERVLDGCGERGSAQAGRDKRAADAKQLGQAKPEIRRMIHARAVVARERGATSSGVQRTASSAVT